MNGWKVMAGGLAMVIGVSTVGCAAPPNEDAPVVMDKDRTVDAPITAALTLDGRRVDVPELSKSQLDELASRFIQIDERTLRAPDGTEIRFDSGDTSKVMSGSLRLPDGVERRFTVDSSNLTTTSADGVRIRAWPLVVGIAIVGGLVYYGSWAGYCSYHGLGVCYYSVGVTYPGGGVTAPVPIGCASGPLSITVGANQSCNGTTNPPPTTPVIATAEEAP